jgi:hypothetical protein
MAKNANPARRKIFPCRPESPVQLWCLTTSKVAFFREPVQTVDVPARRWNNPDADNDETADEKTKWAITSNFHHFEIPDHLLDQLKKRNVVVFAGAGIST